MNKCYFCGEKIRGMPFHCHRCRQIFCPEHRLPERHRCRGVSNWIISKKPDQEIKTESKPISHPGEKQTKTQELSKKITVSKDRKSDALIENTARKKLCEILKDNDRAILEDPKRIRAFLRDLCKGQHSREINAIITLLDEHIPQDMIKSKDKIPYPVLSKNLQKKVKDDTYLSEELIGWTIDSWASALGINHDV